jgi:hypothetical protein
VPVLKEPHRFVMGKTVEERRSHLGVAEDGGPLAEGEVQLESAGGGQRCPDFWADEARALMACNRRLLCYRGLQHLVL